MKFGLRYANTGPYVDPAKAVELALAGEAAGFESIWTVEHVVVPEGYQSTYPYHESGRMAGGAYDMPIPDPLIWMTWVASATTKLKVATGILIVPQRNPVVTAKAVASLDHLSGGRVLLGVGVGWLREEFDAIGADFDDRAAIYDEHLEAMRALWADDRASYNGRFVSFDDVYCIPRPPGGSVPIIIGGHSRAAARRAGRLGDGFFPARGVPDELLSVVRSSAEAAGRDPDQIEITTSMPDDLDQLEELAKAGVDRVLVPVSPFAGLDTVITSPDDCARWAPIIEANRDRPS